MQHAATEPDRPAAHARSAESRADIAQARHALIAAMGAEALADLAAWIATDEAARRVAARRGARARPLPA